MGCGMPNPGEASKIVIEIKGREDLKEEVYNKFKDELKDLIKKHTGCKARIVATELVSAEKESKKMGGK